MNFSRNRTLRGFTLIELLVVIGIIAVLAGGIGVALRDGNPDSAVRSAQGVVNSVLSSARGQAALKQGYAKIIVQADKDKDNFLRLIRVVTSPDNLTSSTWTQVGPDVILPTGVYVVPNGTVAGVTPAGTGRRSTFFGPPAAVSGITDVSSSWLSSVYVINSLGMLVATSSNVAVTNPGNIVLGPGHGSGPAGVALDNYEALRGVVVSRYGIANLVNDAASFGN